MTLHQAIKVVIITEKMIAKTICNIAESCGATGYTIVSAGGKGSRGIRSTSERASVIDDFANVKIEVIVSSKETAERIMNETAKTVFQSYSGIAYMEAVDILRPEKFAAKR